MNKNTGKIIQDGVEVEQTGLEFWAFTKQLLKFQVNTKQWRSGGINK
jgi:hypothetical protein